MKRFRWTDFLLLGFALSLFASAGCHNGVSLSIARDAAAKGDREAAMWAANEALATQPGNPEARQILETSMRSYGEDALRGSSLAKRKAAATLRRLSRRHGVSAGPVVSRLEEAAQGDDLAEASAAFSSAESAFASGDWDRAREGYNQALFLQPGHPQARGKLGQVYSKIGEDLFRQRLYRAASTNFRQAREYNPNDSAAFQRLVACHVELASWYENNGHPRQWLAELQTLRELDSRRQGLSEDMRRAREAATIRLAVLPLEAQGGVNPTVGSLNVPETVQDKVAKKIAARKSEFVTMIDRRNTAKLIKEIHFSLSDFAKPGSQMAMDAFEIADSIVTGRLTQMDAFGPSVQESESGGSALLPLWEDVPKEKRNPDGSVARLPNGAVAYEEQRNYDGSVRRNPDGSIAYVMVTRQYGQQEVPYWYVQAEKTSEAALTGSLAVLHVESSRTLSEQGFSLSDADKAVYAHSFGHGPIPVDARMSPDEFFRKHVPSEVKALLNAPQDVRQPEAIAAALVDVAATEWSVAILREIDEPEAIPEPYGRR